MWASIIALLSNLFGAIPELIKLFKKSTTEKVDKIKKDIDQKEKDFEDTGRPQ